MRTALVATAPAQWPDVLRMTLAVLGFSGQVSNVTAPALQDLDQPLVISYDYRRDNYGGWSDDHIQPPLPALYLPVWNSSHKKLFLGGALQRTFHATVTLPPGYGLTANPPVSARSDFASYQASYAFAAGRFSASRQFDIRRRVLKISDRRQYLTLSQAINGDVNAWTNLTVAAPPSTPAQRSQQLTAAGWQQVQNHQYEAAAATLRQAVQVDPANNYAWNDLGLAQEYQNQLDAAAADFQHAIAADPEDPYAYNNLGMIDARQGKLAQAAAAYRQQIAVNPGDVRAYGNLALLRMRQRDWAGAAAELQAAAKLADSAAIEYNLGEVEYKLHQDAAAAAALVRAAGMKASPLIENNTAFALADHDLDLPRAASLSAAAVASLERDLDAIHLSALTPLQLAEVSMLGASWDTSGWIAFRQGKLPLAESLISAAWRLDEDPIEGDHLGQVYEAEHRRADAERVYAACAAASADAHRRLLALAGSNAAALALMRAHFADPSRARTFLLPGPGLGKLATTVFLQFAPDGRLLDWRGAGVVPRDLPPLLARINYPALAPPSSPVTLVREGMVGCRGNARPCTLFLLPAGTARLVP